MVGISGAGKKGGRGELFSGVVDGIFSGVVCSWTVEYWSILVQIAVVVSVPDCDVCACCGVFT